MMFSCKRIYSGKNSHGKQNKETVPHGGQMTDQTFALLSSVKECPTFTYCRSDSARTQKSGMYWKGVPGIWVLLPLTDPLSGARSVQLSEAERLRLAPCNGDRNSGDEWEGSEQHSEHQRHTVSVSTWSAAVTEIHTDMKKFRKQNVQPNTTQNTHR